MRRGNNNTSGSDQNNFHPNRSNYVNYTNDIRSEKGRIRARLEREIQQRKEQERMNPRDYPVTYESTTPNLPKRTRPTVMEVSGLSGHRTEDTPNSLQEGFASLGKILNDKPSYSFTNNYFQPGVLRDQVSKDRTDEFRKYIDDQRADEEMVRQIAVSEQDLLKTNMFHPASKKFLEDPTAKVDTTKDPYNQPYENTRYNKVRRSVVNIDSAHRDVTRWPNPNNYKIELPRNYQHVKEVRLVSTEIPNTDRVVRDDPAAVKRAKNRRLYQCGDLLNDANNNFYWILEEDADQDWSCLIYNAPLTPGNYVALDCNCGETTIQDEIEQKVASVNTYSDGTPTQFLVDIDTRTNLVTITSIKSDLLEVDPLVTRAGTNIVLVNHTAHGFDETTNNVATILGATSVGGIPASQLNNSHTIENIIDANSYEIRVNTIAGFTATGGGSNVSSGVQKPMKLLFSNVDTIGSILGFPQQDSSDPLSREIEFIQTDPDDLSGNPTNPGENPARIQTVNHGLVPGDTILISDTTTIPDINGLQTVTKIITKDLFEIGVPIKVVNNQTVTMSTRVGQIKQSLDEDLTYVTRVDPEVIGFIQLGNAHGFVLDETIFIGNVVGGLLDDGNSINGIHTAYIIPNNTSFGIERPIVYEGNFGNAFVFKTDSTEVVPITGVVPQNNGVFEPYPVEPVFTGSDVPSYVVLRDFSTLPDVNIDVEVDVDTVFTCGNTVVSTFASQTFETNCTCSKKLLNIWIRVGNPSTVGVSGTLEIINDDTATSLGILAPVDIINESAIGTNFSVSSDLDIIVEPGTKYRWELTTSGGTVSFCGNLGNLYPDGETNLADPNHDYEFRVYVSSDVQKVSYYSVITGRFDLQTQIQDVTLNNLSQNYIRSLSPNLRYIKDAIVQSNGVFRYSVEHMQIADQRFYVRKLFPPYRTTVPTISPSIIGIQTIFSKLNNFQYDTYLDILTSTYSTSSLFSNLVTIRTDDEFPTDIQNIYPQSNGYLGKERQTCDPSRQQCVLCPCDMIYVRYSSLIDCGADGMTTRPFDGCYKINQVYSDVSIVYDDIFDTANIIKGNAAGNLGECVRLDTFNGVDGQNGTFNLAEIYFEPFTQTIPGRPQIWLVDFSYSTSWGPAATSATTFTVEDINSTYFTLTVPSGEVNIWFRVVGGTFAFPPAGLVGLNTITISTTSLTMTIQELVEDYLLPQLDATFWNTFSSSYDSSTNTVTFVALANGPPTGTNSGGTPPYHFFYDTTPIISAQDGQDPSSTTVLTSEALCVRTETPHLLNNGDAIYYTITANNCQTSSGNTLPLYQPLQDTIQFVVPDITDATIFKIYGAGVVSSSNPSLGIKDVQFYYHKICGSTFNPIAKFFPNTYCGMIESVSHGVTDFANIYIGQTTVEPDINGFVNFGNIEVIDNDFLAWKAPCITTGNVGKPFAGEFVFPFGGPSTELTPVDITAQNDGVIIADNSFFGGEQIYFTNDTNINIGSAGELRNRIFTVSTNNLTPDQFGLVETPIVSLNELLGNVVQTFIPVSESTPGVYMIPVPSGTNQIEVELLGAGGGRGPFAGCDGGTGGRIVATFTVENGEAIEPGDVLEYTVGSPGTNGGVAQGMGGTFGSGGDAGSQARIFGSGGFGGGGGGYSRLYNLTKGSILAVAGGGGGGGGYISGPIATRPDGGAGTGSTAGMDGTATTVGAAGSGGTGSGGGAGGVGIGLGGAGVTGGLLIGGDGGTSNFFFSGSSGGGGGGGYYGGGGGGGNSANSGSSGGGGGGSGFLAAGGTATVRDESGSAEGVGGIVNINFRQNVIGFGAGHFAQVPVGETSHGIITVKPNTNATFISSQITNFPNPPGSTTILLTDNSFGDTDIAAIKDKITEATAFKSSAPTYSTTEFTTDIILTDEDIDLGTGILQNNKVDVVSTSDVRFPGLNGLGWVYVNGNIEPIINIIRDSTGRVFPVQADLSVGDKVHFVSDHPTVPDMNGTFTVSYIDIGNVTPQFFELSDLTITNNGGDLANANTSIVYFRTTITGNTTDGCITINEISNSCPTIVRATEHGFPIGSNIDVVILNTETFPPIDIANAGVILDAGVISEDLIELPKTNIDLDGNVVNLCNLDVINQTNLFISQTGTWSQQILSTNCGTPIFESDIANSQTIVTTTSRKNLKDNIALPIANSLPTALGSTTVYVNLPPEYPSLPLNNGQEVIISGHMNANPTIDGTYKVFQVSTNRFKITIPAVFAAVGGTGGFVTLPAPSTIPGHGLYTGYKVMFENVMSTPDINNRAFEITKIDDTRFSIPVLLEDVNNRCPGQWCTNMVNLELVDHGMANNDQFFLYGAERFAGFLLEDINTIHGEKRQNIPTAEEKRTRKIARVIDANNIQFEALSFPYGRTLGGGYDICISSQNHDSANLAAGYINYGFNAVQTNLSCNGELNSFIDLEPEPYIFMTSCALTNIRNTGIQVDDIFAKIQLSDKPGEVLYDTFITSPKIYDDPEKVLEEIDVQFYRRDGKPFDFLGMNHSFALEITEYQDRLLGTNIQSGRMKEDRGPVSQQGFVESTISGFNPEQNLLQPSQLQQATNLTQRINQP